MSGIGHGTDTKRVTATGTGAKQTKETKQKLAVQHTREALAARAEEERDEDESNEDCPNDVDVDDTNESTFWGEWEDRRTVRDDEESQEPLRGPYRLRDLPAKFRPAVRYRITAQGSVEELNPGAEKLRDCRMVLVKAMAACIAEQPGWDALKYRGDWTKITAFAGIKLFWSYVHEWFSAELGRTPLADAETTNTKAPSALRAFAIELPGGAVITPEVLFAQAVSRSAGRELARAAAFAITSRDLPGGSDFVYAFTKKEQQRIKERIKKEAQRARQKAAAKGPRDP